MRLPWRSPHLDIVIFVQIPPQEERGQAALWKRNTCVKNMLGLFVMGECQGWSFDALFPCEDDKE